MQNQTTERWDPLEFQRGGARCVPSRYVREVTLLEALGERLTGQTPDGVRRSGQVHHAGAMVLDRGQAPEATIDYVRHRLERGDIVDLALDDRGLIVGVWVHVYYRNEHLRPEYTRLMPFMKSDALFAARTNPARRSEHWVAVNVLAPVGHDVTALHRADAHGRFPFVIDYAVKDRRSLSEDLRCQRCGRTFEVKARIRDYYRRPSHSRSRPFWEENEPDDFHIFHYRRDNTYEVLLNKDIVATARRMADSGKVGEVDRYLELGRRGDPTPRALRPDEYRCRP